MRFLNNLNFIVKLAIPTIIFVAISVGLIVMADLGLNNLADDTKDLIEKDVSRLTAILQINAEVNEASIQEKNLILLNADQQERLKSGEGVYQEYKKLALQHAKELVGLSDTSERRKVNEDIQATLSAYFDLMDKSVALAMQNNDPAALTISNGEGRDLRKKVRELLTARIDANKKTLAESADDGAELADKTSTTLVASAAIGILAALGLIGAIVIFGIARPLSAMTSAMGQLANGDLSVEVAGTERKDEVGALAR
ncbi:MAG TPA: MCP four helix bundle domain-containing protein, partial [Microvirga sp.]|nr:MCP four helix bundle domain-containing protein [Microvirga sp.]